MATLRTSCAAAGLVFAAGLAGCATPPPPAAVTSYAGANCSAELDLSKAISLTPEREKAEFVVTTPVQAGAACLTRATGTAPYVLYALPAELEDKTLTVGATREAARALAPDVSLLNSRGETVRSFREEDYFFRGPLYSVQFQPRPGEAYVLVAVNPARVGKSFENLQISTSTTAISTGYATATWTSGVETKTSVTFSYEGVVEVMVFDRDAKKKR